MSLLIDRSLTENVIALPYKISQNSLNSLNLDFISKYDRQEHYTRVDVNQRGDFSVGIILSENLPPKNGSYTIIVNDAVSDFLSLRSIHEPLSSINSPLNMIVGASRNEELGRIACIIVGEINISQTNELDDQISQPTAVSSSSAQPSTLSNATIQPIASNTSIAQNQEINRKLDSI